MTSSAPSLAAVELTLQMRRRGIMAAISCTAAASLGLGGLLPLLSITMERMDIAGVYIGLNASMPFISALLVMPFLPRIMARVPLVPMLCAMVIVSAAMVLGYGLLADIWLWMPLRFVNGMALGVLFAASEAWINHFALEHQRGRIIAIYVTVLSGCFAFGPVILWIAGTHGLAPFMLCAALILMSLPFVVRAWNLPEAFYGGRGGGGGGDDDQSPPASFMRFLFIAPTLTLTGIIYGAMEVGVVTFMPIYSLRLGFTELLAASTLTAFALGNICCQIPIGMIADRYDRLKVLLGCACVASASMIMILLLFNGVELITPWILFLFGTLLFLFGAASVGLYTIAMVLIGERFRGAELAAANAALVFCYNLGSLSIPLAAGALIDFAPRSGLPLLLAVLAASVWLPTLWRFMALLQKRLAVFILA